MEYADHPVVDATLITGSSTVRPRTVLHGNEEPGQENAHAVGAVLTTALDYAQRGWSIIPIAAGTTGRSRFIAWGPAEDRYASTGGISTST